MAAEVSPAAAQLGGGAEISSLRLARRGLRHRRLPVCDSGGKRGPVIRGKSIARRIGGAHPLAITKPDPESVVDTAGPARSAADPAANADEEALTRT